MDLRRNARFPVLDRVADQILKHVFDAGIQQDDRQTVVGNGSTAGRDGGFNWLSTRSSTASPLVCSIVPVAWVA